MGTGVLVGRQLGEGYWRGDILGREILVGRHNWERVLAGRHTGERGAAREIIGREVLVWRQWGERCWC